jgi:hypothetical protein
MAASQSMVVVLYNENGVLKKTEDGSQFTRAEQRLATLESSADIIFLLPIDQ